MEDTFKDSFPQPKMKGSKGKKFIFILIVLLLLGVLGYGGYKTMGSKVLIGKASSPSVTPTEIPIPTDSPTPNPSISISPQTSKTPTPKPTTSVLGSTSSSTTDKATGLDRSKLTIEVLNGGGQVGAASKASDYLKSLGYKVVSSGNADTFDYEKTLVGVVSAKAKYLPLLKKDLSSSYALGTQTATSSSSTADAVVIIGKE